jgi:riboflavin synthase
MASFESVALARAVLARVVLARVAFKEVAFRQVAADARQRITIYGIQHARVAGRMTQRGQ